MENESKNNGSQAPGTALTQYRPQTVYRPQTALTIPRGKALLDGMQLETLADACWKSGMFKDVKSAFGAIVKIKAGIELGIPPMQAMNGVYIIEGKTCLAATLMGALIKASGKYTYRIQQIDNNAVSIAFFERDDEGKWVSCGPNSTFSMQDAEKAGVAGKGVWKSWPRNMMFARALSNGARWYCGDVFLGPVYVPEELGVEVNEEGEVAYADVKPEDVRTAPPPPPNLVRNDWQREAAKQIYPAVSPEIVDEIRQTANNPLYSEEEFTEYLVGIADTHAIDLPAREAPGPRPNNEVAESIRRACEDGAAAACASRVEEVQAA